MIRQALIASLSLLGFANSASAEATGEALFVQHCSRCHTTAGTGLGPAHPSLDRFVNPPADFTDAMFNSMEPQADWFLVVKYGGHSMGLSEQMPAHASRLSDAEIERVVSFLEGFADTRGYPKGDLNFRRPVATIKAFPETELLVLGRFDDADEGASSWKSTLYHARRLGKQVAVEAKLSHLATADDSKLDEIEFGIKWAALQVGRSFLLSVGTELALSFDDFERPELIPYTSYALPLGDAFTLQGTVKSHLPVREFSAGDIATSHVIHWQPLPWPRGLIPGFEATLTQPFEGGDPTVSVIPQLFAAFSKRGHVGLAVGVEVPLMGASYRYRAHSFLFWDMADGPFWEGW